VNRAMFITLIYISLTFLLTRCPSNGWTFWSK